MGPKINKIGSYIGFPSDSHTVDTVMGRLKLLKEHAHRPNSCYPFQKDPITLTAGATAWVGDGAIVSLTNVESTVDNAAAVDIGGGVVQFPVTGHHVKVGYSVTIPTSTNYTGTYTVVAVAANTVNVTATYVAETFAGTEALTDVIPLQFDIHRVDVSALSANGNYEVVLFSGASGSEVEICRIAATRNTVQSQEGAVDVGTILLAAKTRISARVLSGNAAADTCAVKFDFHTYD